MMKVAGVGGTSIAMAFSTAGAPAADAEEEEEDVEPAPLGDEAIASALNRRPASSSGGRPGAALGDDAPPLFALMLDMR